MNALMQRAAGILLSVGLAGSACAAQTVTLTEADAGQTRQVGIDNTIEIRLKAQLGTGYSWGLQSPAQAGLSATQPPSISKGTLPGGSQEQVFSFGAAKPGNYRLIFGYGQPWTKTIERRAEFMIIVQARE